jgi:NAD(P)-dependent dehydrogenase (short-subunit alcohol dehydrogenase family)
VRRDAIAFNPSTDIPTLTGKTILITGANIGLGKQSVLEFARHAPSRIWLASRNPTKAHAAIQEILAHVPEAPVTFLELDLASFDSVCRAAERFCQQSDRLDILMLNAGIMGVPEGLTDNGFEVHFGTNHMGHALLTRLLLPTLLATSQLPGADVRVVILTSAGLAWARRGGIDFDILKSTAPKLSKNQRYGQSKLANVLFGRELARRFPQLTVASVHPGVVRTNLAAPAMEQSAFLRLVLPVISSTLLPGPVAGVKNQLWAAVSKAVESGNYYEPVGVTRKVQFFAAREKLSLQLWEWTEAELDALPGMSMENVRFVSPHSSRR